MISTSFARRVVCATCFIRECQCSSPLRRQGSAWRGPARFLTRCSTSAWRKIGPALTSGGERGYQGKARVAQAERRLSKALSQELKNRLPTSKSGNQWWVDPIIGLRTQINFTRWLFLALQGDVGGFGAGSEIAWFASGSIGINFTRNIFTETGYRYFYMDYVKNGLIYDAAQSGFFTGVGVKF